MEGLFVYQSRLSLEYRIRVKNQLEQFIVIDRNMDDADWEELKSSLPSVSDNDKYLKNIKGKRFTHCLRIDFCGLSSSTLLNTNNKGKDPNQILNSEIERLFMKLISEKNTDILNKNSIYLKLRFLFAYRYSEFPFSLMKAEQEKKRMKSSLNEEANDSHKLNYSFAIEPGLEIGELEHSTIKVSQGKSLMKLQTIIDTNKHLKRTLHDKEVNTIQVRFTPIPVNFCMLVINKNAYMDSYIYAMQEWIDQLSYLYPLVEIDLGLNKDHGVNLDNHYDYLWHHDLTMLSDDCTHVNSGNLAKIKLPHDINWEIKKKIIEEHLKDNKKKKNEYSDPIKKRWENNISRRFLSSIKYPFDDFDTYDKEVSVIFTDFVGFTNYTQKHSSESVVALLELCFNEFEEICAKHKIYKIKTIGDAFMCLSGLEKNRSNVRTNAMAAIEAAKEMIDFISLKRRELGGDDFFTGMRVGISTGHATIRKKQLEIDVWGKTVNRASRLEQISQMDKICICKDTYELVKNVIACENLQEDEIKGLGNTSYAFVN